MLEKDDRWFATISWSKACINCQSETNGVCRSRGCAELHYDPWGDELPAYLYYPDGNDVEKYLENKRKRMEAVTR